MCELSIEMEKEEKQKLRFFVKKESKDVPEESVKREREEEEEGGEDEGELG